MENFKEYNFKGKRTLVRVDFNVPLNDKLEVTDDARIHAAIPTIKKIIKDGGKAILMSHLGRPKNGYEEKFSLKNIVSTLEKNLGYPVLFVDDCTGEKSLEATNQLKNGEVALLENLRFYPEEKQGDEFFAGQLAEHADVYVNDAFGTAHRAHASTAVIAKFFPNDKMFGLLLEREIVNMDRVLYGAKQPVTAIIGGAKVSSKINILLHLIEKMDNIIIGGGMAFTFARAQGGKIGSSLVEDDKLDVALTIIRMAKENTTNLYIPVDSVVADGFSNDSKTQIAKTDQIPDGWMGLDIGPGATDDILKIIRESRTILWNGPMGVFEMDNFAKGTKKVAQKLAEVTQSGSVFTLVGGGDSVAAINKFGLADKVSYVSTGGGAMLEYLEGKVLPGIEAIKS